MNATYFRLSYKLNKKSKYVHSIDRPILLTVVFTTKKSLSPKLAQRGRKTKLNR